MEPKFVTEFGLYYLNLIGLNPFKPVIERAKGFIFVAITITLYALNLIGMIDKYDGIRSLEDSIDTVPGGQQTVVKLLSVIFLAKKMRDLFNMVEHNWPDDICGEKLEKALTILSLRFKKFINAYRMTCYFTASLFACKPLILFSRILLSEWYIPCDISNNYCYAFFLMAQMVYFGIMAFIVVMFDAIFFGFLFHAYCELEKIKYSFKHLNISTNTEDDEESEYSQLIHIVRYHNFMLKFVDSINEVYYLQLLNHFTTIVATIVFGIFFLNMDGFPPSFNELSRYIPYLTLHHFQLYMYCKLGEMVYDQLYSVGDMVYQSKWYVKRQLKLTKCMLLVMMVSNGENKLTIGNLWKLNLETFMQVIKTSASVHAFMQTVYQDEDNI